MIIKNNIDVLRVTCLPTTEEEALGIIEELEKELKNSARLGKPGIGLAAPQIGINKQVAIIRFDKVKVNLVNCKIANGYDLAEFENEACLSFPGLSKNTMRYQEIHVTDNLVSPNSFIATGLLSVAIQHELDHLNGILLVDK